MYLIQAKQQNNSILQFTNKLSFTRISVMNLIDIISFNWKILNKFISEPLKT